jgi:Mitochondrial carrier protein
MELVRIKVQVQQGFHSETSGSGKPLPAAAQRRYAGSLDCFKKILKYEGVKGLTKGFVPTLVRESFGFGAFFAGYEFMVRQLAGAHGTAADLKAHQVLACGSFAGVCFWAPMYPVGTFVRKSICDVV